MLTMLHKIQKRSTIIYYNDHHNLHGCKDKKLPADQDGEVAQLHNHRTMNPVTALTKTLGELSETSANVKNFIAEAATGYTRLNLKPNLERN